jgi:hypothetical protein
MTDQGRHGADWNEVELDAIIADYFVMLGDELAQRPYVKSQHRAALMEMTGRTAPSIEFKHRNISAVLQDSGSPWIWGYKPAPNYQDALYDAVSRYVSVHGGFWNSCRYKNPLHRISMTSSRRRPSWCRVRCAPLSSG